VVNVIKVQAIKENIPDRVNAVYNINIARQISYTITNGTDLSLAFNVMFIRTMHSP